VLLTTGKPSPCAKAAKLTKNTTKIKMRTTPERVIGTFPFQKFVSEPKEGTVLRQSKPIQAQKYSLFIF
jgi:hypothetical protein